MKRTEKLEQIIATRLIRARLEEKGQNSYDTFLNEAIWYYTSALLKGDLKESEIISNKEIKGCHLNIETIKAGILLDDILGGIGYDLNNSGLANETKTKTINNRYDIVHKLEELKELDDKLEVIEDEDEDDYENEDNDIGCF